jgi:hypothetical protein
MTEPHVQLKVRNGADNFRSPFAYPSATIPGRCFQPAKSSLSSVRAGTQFAVPRQRLLNALIAESCFAINAARSAALNHSAFFATTITWRIPACENLPKGISGISEMITRHNAFVLGHKKIQNGTAG